MPWNKTKHQKYWCILSQSVQHLAHTHLTTLLRRKVKIRPYGVII